mmetsp:Transcript_43611/g.81952  ORF Transcript_43611/g.81952 Transcript_43611/m.81952 type:complete len:225 (+) Transcript_43611:162-836(+)
MCIQAISALTSHPKAAHTPRRIIINDTPFRVVIEAIVPLAASPKSTRIEIRIYGAALRVHVHAVPLLAGGAESTGLPGFYRSNLLLFSRPGTFLNDVLWHCPETRRQTMRHALIVRVIVEIYRRPLWSWHAKVCRREAIVARKGRKLSLCHDLIAMVRLHLLLHRLLQLLLHLSLHLLLHLLLHSSLRLLSRLQAGVCNSGRVCRRTWRRQRQGRLPRRRQRLL